MGALSAGMARCYWLDLVSLEVCSPCRTTADGRDWAVIVPSYLMVIVLLAYWSYAALTPLLSPRFDSADLIVGGSLNSLQEEAANIQTSTLPYR